MQVTIAKNTASVNPKHVVFVIMNKETLETIVLTMAGKFKSDFSFDETNKILNDQDQEAI